MNYCVSSTKCRVQSSKCSECAAEALTAALPCLGALHDVSEHLLHHLAVGKAAAVVLTLPLPLQALVCVKEQHQLLLDELCLLLVGS